MARDSPSDDAITAAADVVDVLRQFGLSDEEIVGGAIEAPDSIRDATKAVAVDGAVVRGLGTGGDPDRAKTGTVRGVLSESGRGVTVDNMYHHKRTLEVPLDRALAEFGYGFEFRSVGSDEWIEPEHPDHPRAFRLVVVDDANDPVATAAFRYPPTDGAHPSRLCRALGTALNDTVLAAIDVRMLLLDDGSGSFKWVVVDRETLETLASAYGPTLAAFGEPLVQRGPEYKYGFREIDRSAAVDHQSEFGVPEPEETFAIERAYDL
ncbi:hypothetical protein [Natrinema altunense]|uniref:Uncharacterized protein n=1 Tax=Natrinema altunense TaxID=222984 RepID=A0A482XY57_9EURY|nr:hypothetical protein [Natrinema altunense]RZH66875.1 hypothetical protein ELS17_13950 [Natrinema altunense]